MTGTAPAADRLPTGAEKVAQVRAMFDTIAPRYDLVNRLMTFGLDIWWRRRTVAALGLPPGSRVLDVACGTGDLVRLLRRRSMRAVGVDLSRGMLEAGPDPAGLVQADAAGLPVGDGTVDGVVSGFALRNFADLPAVLDELARVLRPGGRLALLDVDAPRQRWLRAGHRLWFTRGAPAVGAALSDPDAYRYLPRSVAYLPPGPELRRLIAGAGFSTVNHRALSGGVVQLLTATRAGRPRP